MEDGRNAAAMADWRHDLNELENQAKTGGVMPYEGMN
jgi:hypothetical protein